MKGTPSGHKKALDAEEAVSSESKQHTHTLNYDVGQRQEMEKGAFQLVSPRALIQME